MTESADLKAKLLTLYWKTIKYRNKAYYEKLACFIDMHKKFSSVVISMSSGSSGQPKWVGPSPLIRVWGSPQHTSLKLYWVNRKKADGLYI